MQHAYALCIASCIASSNAFLSLFLYLFIYISTKDNAMKYSDFLGGIGSEGYVAVKDGRKYIGIELKKSYFDLACKNLAAAVEESNELTLFDMKQVV